MYCSFEAHYRRATRAGGGGEGEDLPCPKSEFQNLCPNFRTASVKGGSFLCHKCVNRVLTIFLCILLPLILS